MILRNLKIVGNDNETKDIVIKNDTITEIKQSNHSTGDKDDIILDFWESIPIGEDCIAFPGLINSHDHLEFNLYPQLAHRTYQDYVEWGNDIHSKDEEIINTIESIPVELRLKYGIIKNLLCGVTTVAHHGSYHPCLENSPITMIKNCTCLHSVKLGGKWKLKLNWIRNLEPYVIHIGEGLNKKSSDEIDDLIRWNIFKRKIIGIHGIAMTKEQSKNFEALVWCPVSNFFLFNKTADISSLKEDTKILFGTDSTLTAGCNIWSHLRIAKELKFIDDKELFNSLTKQAAAVWELKDYGEISNGKRADIVIAKKKSEDLLESFYLCNPEDIILILKNGNIILFDETLKEKIKNEENYLKKFKGISVNGKIKFINESVTDVIEIIKKYYPKIELHINLET